MGSSPPQCLYARGHWYALLALGARPRVRRERRPLLQAIRLPPHEDIRHGGKESLVRPRADELAPRLLQGKAVGTHVWREVLVGAIIRVQQGAPTLARGLGRVLQAGYVRHHCCVPAMVALGPWGRQDGVDVDRGVHTGPVRFPPQRTYVDEASTQGALRKSNHTPAFEDRPGYRPART